ncbi:ComF family protein [Piscibacillus halophilus]|uniref:Competence protein ComFC n=1 Tax=Piscibacillus halophilus TaxID=571933 RepID=A0A1H9EIZ3_9BACI|nr:ComF family protein [Piscibacillus halophilus]SEQ25527.1 competence protein ComFC [Piscibacillus halophilus]
MHCLICYQEIDSETTWTTIFEINQRVLCDVCQSRFERIEDMSNHCCEKCMRPIEQSISICGDCYAWQERLGGKDPLHRNVSIFNYNSFMKDVMALFKYRGDYELVKVWESDVKTTFQKCFSEKFTLVPIPLSKKRLEERGFNQAEAIAKLIDPNTAFFIERTHTEKQSKKTKRERIFSKNPFKLKGIPSSHILLIDDLYTTGTTLRQAAQLLIDSGAKVVQSLTLIRS